MTAYSRRDAVHSLNINAVWLPHEPIGEDEAAWARDFHRALEPHRQGAYVNFLDRDDRDQLPEVFGDTTYTRLVALKDRYDADNVFSSNHNIRPSTAAAPGTVPKLERTATRAPHTDDGRPRGVRGRSRTG